jgi:hypothetical protein
MGFLLGSHCVHGGEGRDFKESMLSALKELLLQLRTCTHDDRKDMMCSKGRGAVGRIEFEIQTLQLIYCASLTSYLTSLLFILLICEQNGKASLKKLIVIMKVLKYYYHGFFVLGNQKRLPGSLGSRLTLMNGEEGELEEGVMRVALPPIGNIMTYRVCPHISQFTTLSLP